MIDLSVDDLIAAVGAADGPLTPRQVARWHRAGLLPTPVPRSRGAGGGRGKLYGYPIIAVRQLRALLALLKIKQRLAWVGYMLWWNGYVVGPRYVRDPLSKAAERLQSLRAAFETADSASDADLPAADAALDVAIVKFLGKHRPPVSEIRKGYYEMLLRTLVGVGVAPDEEGLEAYRTIIPLATAPDALATGTVRLSRFQATMGRVDFGDVVESMTPEDLEAVRLEIVSTVAEFGVLGASQPGRRPNADRFRLQNPFDPLALLWRLALRQQQATASVLGPFVPDPA